MLEGTLCIPKEYADKLTKAVYDGVKFDEFKSSDERRKELRKHIPDELIKFANTKLEEGLARDTKDVVENWIKRISTEKDRAEYKTDKKIKRVKNILENRDQVLEDLFSDILGVNIKESEVSKILELSGALNRATEADKDKPYVKKIDQWKAMANIEEYLSSLETEGVPGLIKHATGTFRQAEMLLRGGPVVQNIVGNFIRGSMGAVGRRIASSQYESWEPYQKQYNEDAGKLYNITNVDMSRMRTMEDYMMSRGEKTTDPGSIGKLRKGMQFVEHLSLGIGQGKPDQIAGSFAFTDRAGIESSRLARLEGKSGEEYKIRKKEIFDDACSLTPKTQVGKECRDKAINDALTVTFRNESKLTDAMNNIRSSINKISVVRGVELQIGTILQPFVTTTANIAQYGARLSSDVMTKSMSLAIDYKRLKTGDITINEFNDIKAKSLREIGSSAFFVASSLAIASLIDDKDYMPDYFLATRQEKDLARQFKIPFGSIQIAGKWISLDYLPGINIPLKSVLQAKRDGRNGDGSWKKVETWVSGYSAGVISAMASVPGLSTISGIYKSMQDYMQEKDKPKAIKEGSIDSTVGLALSFAPGVMLDIANFSAKSGMFSVGDYLPESYKKIDEKTNIFGESLYHGVSMAGSSLLFGSRVSWYTGDDEVYDEMVRLASVHFLPPLNDIEKSSKKVKDYINASNREDYLAKVSEFKTKFGESIIAQIHSTEYLNASDAEKAKRISAIKNAIVNSLFRREE